MKTVRKKLSNSENKGVKLIPKTEIFNDNMDASGKLSNIGNEKGSITYMEEMAEPGKKTIIGDC